MIAQARHNQRKTWRCDEIGDGSMGGVMRQCSSGRAQLFAEFTADEIDGIDGPDSTNCGKPGIQRNAD